MNKTEQNFEQFLDMKVHTGVMDALKKHKDAGVSITVWQDGKVVKIKPEDIKLTYLYDQNLIEGLEVYLRVLFDRLRDSQKIQEKYKHGPFELTFVNYDYHNKLKCRVKLNEKSYEVMQSEIYGEFAYRLLLTSILNAAQLLLYQKSINPN